MNAKNSDLTRRYDPNNLYFVGKYEDDMVVRPSTTKANGG